MSVRHWPGQVTTVVQSIAREYRRKNVSFMAGSIAYSAFVSLLPLLLLALLVATAVGGQQFASFVVGLTEQYLTPAAQTLLSDALVRASSSTQLSVISLVVLLWGVLKVFRSLDVAFSSLYDTPGRNGILDQIKDGLVVLVGIGVAVVATFVAGLAVALLPDVPFIGTLSVLFLVVALAVVFLPVYYVFPDVDVTVRDVLPGALIAAVGWSLLQILFQVYVSFSSTSELYGVLGAVVLLITYLYFASVVVLVGVTTNVVLSNRTDHASPSTGPGTQQPSE